MNPNYSRIASISTLHRRGGADMRDEVMPKMQTEHREF